MSRKICVQFEVKNMAIMKNTLKQIDVDFNEISDERLEIHRLYHPIVIDSKIGNISYDEVNEKEVTNIKKEYTVNYYRDKCLREGNQLKIERRENGEIVLNVV